MSDQAEKRAPVQGYPGGIPWAIHLEAYEVYCKRYGAQPALIDLEGDNCRGGFGTRELDDFIPGWRDRVSEFGMLKTEVLALRAQVASLTATLLAAQRGPVGAAFAVLKERKRQVEAEGWTPEHDDEHDPGELAAAAAAYAIAAADLQHPLSAGDGGYIPGNPPSVWPWEVCWWKPTTAGRCLEKAGALLLAALEQIHRAQERTAREANHA